MSVKILKNLSNIINAQKYIGRQTLYMLDFIGYGGVLLAENGYFIDINEIAELYFKIENNKNKEDLINSEGGREIIKHLLSLGNGRFTISENNLVVVERKDRRPLILHATVAQSPNFEGIHTLLILVDLDFEREIETSSLKIIFGLTEAEARLAKFISKGYTPSEIATDLNLSIATIRTQLASIYNKTRTRRQAELVSLVNKLSIIR
ncbi:helix-turn-helix transcriptional regulator [Methylobacterium sp. ap11]|uniref:helix-turn-helix transcriptional regulator n=1 Tax=Methylobacterium sp. ap11 TaxID=1761799 RepID=UPI000B839399|nr:helix-turn-helix transcriptional regulator [Methylobacterium sp. ap11]